MQYIVYKLTRDDNVLYIGTTNTQRYSKRMGEHKNHKRFKNHSFKDEILEKSTDYDYIQSKEADYIENYDTYKNGLNDTINGSGNHLSQKFTTKGYKFSDQQRKNMSIAGRGKHSGKNNGMYGRNHTRESKTIMSKKRIGVSFPKILTQENVNQIRKNFKEQKFINETYLSGNGKEYIIGDTLQNGIKLNYLTVFSKIEAKEYNISSQLIRAIIQNKTWKQ